MARFVDNANLMAGERMTIPILLRLDYKLEPGGNNGIGIAGIALTTDTSTLTSIANDVSFAAIFSRQPQALAIAIARSGDGQARCSIRCRRAASGAG